MAVDRLRQELSIKAAHCVPEYLTGLRADCLSGTKRPAEVIEEIFGRIQVEGLSPVWISLADELQTMARARSVDLSLPLAGIAEQAWKRVAF